MNLVGRSGTLVLFSDGNMGALVDESTNTVVRMDKISALTASVPYKSLTTVSETAKELAVAALTNLNINIIPTTDRMHTIPKAVQLEAKRALEWYKREGRGGTPVSLHVAETLAAGGQIGVRQIRNIAKFFPRHESDKFSTGYSPKTAGYPSAGRIAWGLHGGEAAQKWAINIVDRENRKNNSALVASDGIFVHEIPQPVDLDSFDKKGSEFIIRVRQDGSGVDRLYQIEGNGKVSVWDDGCWDDLGHVNHDIDTYDRSLDDAYDTVHKEHVPVDRTTALVIAAMLDSDPATPKELETIEPEEAEMFSAAEPEIDWDEIDGILAAGDGKYTPEERAKNASAQVRDAHGRFAETGSRVVIGGNNNYKGQIVSIDPDTKSANVKLDSGKTINVPVNTTVKEGEEQAGDGSAPATNPTATAPSGGTGAPTEPVDVDGILAPPKKSVNKEKARLEGRPDVVGAEELKKMLDGYPSRVADYRSSDGEPIKAAADPAPNDFTDPSKSDVPPLYMAIVANDDPQAVMDLVALIPAGPKTTAPVTFKRKPGKWERDDQLIQDLNSPTPPPVVMLDEDTLKTVMSQIDSISSPTEEAPADSTTAPAPTSAPTPVPAPVAAAGGLDRNRGNAEKLRRYWLYGKGAAKIRWNTGGDWKRCVRHLAKYMGPRAKGYCALRHKEATGMWTGDKLHRQMYGRTASGEIIHSNDYIATTEQIITRAMLRARAADARSRVLTAAAPVQTEGSKFVIPLVIPEGIESGDGRIFDKGAISIRDLPLPLLWQIQTADGHTGSVVVGKITHMERVENGIGNAHGVFDTGAYGKEANRLVEEEFLRGVSADLDQFEADQEVEDGEENENGEPTKIETGRITIKKARVMAVTLVPKPAFQECTIQIADNTVQQEEDVVPDGVYVEDVDALEASALIACGIVAGVIPTNPPAEWFENPNLTKASPLTVDDEGRVYGHIAAWHVDHIGMSFGTRPPKSRSNYAYFHTGVVRTEEGTDIPVGQLTLAGGHASLEMSAQEAVRHYDDTASAIADIHAGEDAFGIWVAGALRPGTSPEQIRALRASAPSGDWRPIKGRLELVGVLQVNVPGFPIARSRVASGQVMALVAAGASTLARMKNDPVMDLHARIDRLEEEQRAPLVAAADDAKLRMLSIKAKQLSDRIHYNELSDISQEVRDRLAKEGKALPDGSYPIRNTTDLKNAIHAYGRSKPGDRAKVRRHIEKRARALGKWDLVPEDWKSASNEDAEGKAEALAPEGISALSIRERAAAAAAAMTAAGGLDRNRGNAERLRRYWVHGAGAAKIRWGMPGDWSRCVRHLAKHMGPRAKGYCQLRHKEALGYYTSTHAKMHKGRHNSVVEAEFENSEALYENLESFATEVTDDDMACPMEEIHARKDDLFDRNWEPDPQIVILIKEEEENEGDEAPGSVQASAEFATRSKKSDDEVDDLTPEEIQALKQEKTKRDNDLKLAPSARGKYTAETQPRDANGRFRTVLARLKSDLGDAGLERVMKKVEIAENLDHAGDYAGAVEASKDLISTIDRLDSGALDATKISNVRATAGELGKVIANLPFNFDNQAQKIRFSDVPPALRDLIKDMIERVDKKIGKKDADIATKGLQEFMSGSDLMSQSDISSQMSKLLRLLT